ncbi:hypothetical protein [Lysinibacillus fusiformis]|uniref:hypothetical protein n=1 Tax=Lysinibacillus fusiformis TaxID=28031 RepID=UPI00188274A9|nr:hypothetical protein [Lysinibacillus fusiformis]MBD8521472.1 hypothetical protein [Lysinibacillus fusiformis]
MTILFDKWIFAGSNLIGEMGSKLNPYSNRSFSTDKIINQMNTIASFGPQNGFICMNKFKGNTNITANSAFLLYLDSTPFIMNAQC